MTVGSNGGAVTAIGGADKTPVGESGKTQVVSAGGGMLSNLIHVDQVSPMERDRVRVLRHFIAFFIWVGLPTILAGIYYGMVASDMYVSEAKVTVRNVQRSSGILDNFISKTLGSGSNEDAALVSDYMQSRQMLQELQDLVDIRTMYSRQDADALSRLAPSVTSESFYQYFKSVVRVRQDTNTGITTLQVRAFAPLDAQMIAETMIALTDALLDDITEGARRDALGYAKGELTRLEDGMRELNNKLMAFRNEGSDIDPMLSARSVHRIVAQLEAELVKTRTRLTETESFMLSDSTQVVAMRNRISALEQQLANEKERLTGGEQGTFTQSVSVYEGLLLEKGLLEKAYGASLAGYESAKSDMQQRQAYLVAYVPPNLPDEAIYPNRLVSILTVSFGAMLFYGIGTLLLSSIKEHSRV